MEFETGKFYMVAVGWSCRKIPALCVQVAKHFVKFEYLSKNGDLFEKYSTKRKLIKTSAEGGNDSACVYDLWSPLPFTHANELAEKPNIWDSIPSPLKIKKPKGNNG